MSKRNKRGKKGREGSSVNSTSSKRGRDEVTGLNAEIWGKKVYSDKVYDMAEYGPLSEEIYDDGGGELSFEYELGRNAIAYTVKTSRVAQIDGQPISFEESRSRWVFAGEFTYDKKGRFKSGTVTEVTNWTSNKRDRVGGWSFEYGSIDRGAAVTAKSLTEVTQAFEKNMERVYDHSNLNNDIAGDAKSDFYNFESSKYFENGWWDNPFAPNLI